MCRPGPPPCSSASSSPEDEGCERAFRRQVLRQRWCQLCTRACPRPGFWEADRRVDSSRADTGLRLLRHEQQAGGCTQQMGPSRASATLGTAQRLGRGAGPTLRPLLVKVATELFLSGWACMSLSTRVPGCGAEGTRRPRGKDGGRNGGRGAEGLDLAFLLWDIVRLLPHAHAGLPVVDGSQAGTSQRLCSHPSAQANREPDVPPPARDGALPGPGPSQLSSASSSHPHWAGWHSVPGPWQSVTLGA